MPGLVGEWNACLLPSARPSIHSRVITDYKQVEPVSFTSFIIWSEQSLTLLCTSRQWKLRIGREISRLWRRTSIYVCFLIKSDKWLSNFCSFHSKLPNSFSSWELKCFFWYTTVFQRSEDGPILCSAKTNSVSFSLNDNVNV